MTKKEMTKIILDAKKDKGLTWEMLGAKTGLNPVCIAAACLGNGTLSIAEAAVLTESLSLSDEIGKVLTEYPTKGDGQVIPSDPLIYRFFEIGSLKVFFSQHPLHDCCMICLTQIGYFPIVAYSINRWIFVYLVDFQKISFFF